MRILRVFSVVVCAAALLQSSARAADSKTTRQLLTKLTDDLQTLWKDYASEKQKDTRDKAIQDYQQSFSASINTAEVPPGLKMQAVVQTFIDNMERSATLWRLDKMASTRNAYLMACAMAFKREFANCSDYVEARTTQKAYDLLLNWLENARDSLRKTHPDAQTQTYGAINEVAGNMINAATVPPGDSLAQLDKNLQDARKRFPVNSDALKPVNQNILQIAEQRAKDVQAKSTRK